MLKKLALALLSVATLVLTFGATVHADSAGYLDQWLGSIRVRYANQGLPVVPPPPLAETFAANWLAKHDYICNFIHGQVETSRWRACDLPISGELRGRMLGPNLLGLKYVVRGNHIKFDATTDSVFGSWADPTIEATFDLELDLTFAFDQGVDGAVSASAPEYLSTPITVRDAHAHLSQLQLSTKNLAASAMQFYFGSLTRAGEKLDKNPQLSADLLQDTTEESNAQLHDGAWKLAVQYRQPKPASNAVFTLEVSLNADRELVIEFGTPVHFSTTSPTNPNPQPSPVGLWARYEAALGGVVLDWGFSNRPTEATDTFRVYRDGQVLTTGAMGDSGEDEYVTKYGYRDRISAPAPGYGYEYKVCPVWSGGLIEGKCATTSVGGLTAVDRPGSDLPFPYILP